MLLTVVALLIAVGLGRLSGGRLSHLGALRPRRGGLLPLALLIQIAGAVVGGPGYPVGLALSVLLAGVFLASNRALRGTGLVTLGLVANTLVVVGNGAMPVSDAALGRAGVSSQDIVSGADRRHVLAGPGTRLRWLGDVVPVLLPRYPQVVSPGDVLITAGLAQLVVVGMRAGARTRRPRHGRHGR